MPLTQQLLLSMSSFWELFFIVIMFSVILAVGFVFLLALVFPKIAIKKHQTGWMVFLTGGPLLYTLLLMVVLFSSWQDWKTTALNVRKEANALIELYRSTQAFLPELKDRLQGLLTQYVKSIVDEEWPLLARSELSPHTTVIAKKMWEAYTSYSPHNETEQIFLTESIRKLIELRELRDTRRLDSTMGVPFLLWSVLLVGFIVMVFRLTLYVDDMKDKLKIVIPYTILVGCIFVAILTFDFPFTGAPIVSSDPIAQTVTRW